MESGNSAAINWHQIAKVGILFTKILVLVFILCFCITWTWDLDIEKSYKILLVGLEITLFLNATFLLIRMNTFQPKSEYDIDKLIIKNQQLSLLLKNITYDIDRFEEGSAYYFNGVRMYKYFTAVLSGISTILLGLDYKSIFPDTTITDSQIYINVTKNIAFVIGAIVTVYSGIMTYWNVEKYWLQNKSVVNKLRALRDEIENEDSAKNLDDVKIQDKFDKYQLIKGEFYKYWEGALSGRSAQA